MVNRPGQDQIDKSLLVVAICLDSETLKTVQQVCKALKCDLLGNFPQYVGTTNDPGLMQRFSHPTPDVVLIDFDADRERAASTAEQLAEITQNKAAIFALSTQSEPELIISAMRSGCSEYLIKPLAAERFQQALLKLEGRKRDRARAQRRGKVVTLLGAKGGSGVTTLSTHLAVFLQKLGKSRTLLIDQHPDLGDVAMYLGIDKHLYHFYELVGNASRLDANLVEGFVVHHASGVDVLAGPSAFDATVDVAEQDVEFTIDYLRTLYDFIVIDCTPGLTGLNVAAVQKADQVWLVATPDVPSIRNLSRYLEHLERFNQPAETIRVVINRYSKTGVITREQIEKALKRHVPITTVPNSYAEIIQAINIGTAVAVEKKSEFAAAMRRCAEEIVGQAAAAPKTSEPKRRFGILGIAR